MPTNQNQNEKDTDTEDNAAVSEVDSGEKGSLNNAYVRTLVGDIHKKRGISESTNAFIPKPSSKESSVKNGSQKKRRNDAVVHTFKDDVQHLVRNRKMSIARIAALESDRREEEGQDPLSPEPKKTGIIMSLLALFLVIAAVFGLGAYYLYQGQLSSNVSQQLDPPVVFVEARERVDISDMNARGIIDVLATTRRNTFAALGSVVELYLMHLQDDETRSTELVHVSSTAFLTAIEARIPPSFIQTLQSEYMLGIHTIDENVPFLILKTQSYGHAFSGMLAWEPHIESDLLPFFSPRSDFIKPAAAEGANVFSDDVVENLDVRVLTDADGNIRIVYAFVDRSTMVLTTDIRTLTELSQRARIR